MQTIKNTPNTTIFHLDDPKSNNIKMKADPRLSVISVGILAKIYLIFDNEDHTIIKYRLLEESGLGQTLFDRGWADLEKYGYIKKTRIQRGYTMEIFETPLN